jgi:hypothetical protein
MLLEIAKTNRPLVILPAPACRGSEFGSREAGDEESKDPEDVSITMLSVYSSTMKVRT